MFESYENTTLTLSPVNINIGLHRSIAADQVADVCQIARCIYPKELHSCSHIIWINLTENAAILHTVYANLACHKSLSTLT